MFQKIIQLSIKNKVTIGMLTLVLIIWGTWSLSQLPFDSTPDITNNQVQVITQAPSLGAQEVEQFARGRAVYNHSSRNGFGQHSTCGRTQKHQ